MTYNKILRDENGVIILVYNPSVFSLYPVKSCVVKYTHNIFRIDICGTVG